MPNGERRTLSVDLPEEGASSPPRANGELVFEAPWEGRVFGLTMSLVEVGTLSWSDFQRELVAEIGRWEQTHDVETDEYSYYERWLAALEVVLSRERVCEGGELAAKLAELARRPADHDHRH